MPPGRPPADTLPAWPALMTTALAARYLSLDESSLRVVARAAAVGPVDLQLDLERWRRADLDRLVRGLPNRPPSSVERASPSTATTKLSDADLDRIAARVRGASPGTERKVYSIKDASAACGLSRSTIYRLAQLGRLKPIRLAGRTLIPAEQVDALIAKGD